MNESTQIREEDATGIGPIKKLLAALLVVLSSLLALATWAPEAEARMSDRAWYRWVCEEQAGGEFIELPFPWSWRCDFGDWWIQCDVEGDCYKGEKWWR